MVFMEWHVVPTSADVTVNLVTVEFVIESLPVPATITVLHGDSSPL